MPHIEQRRRAATLLEEKGLASALFCAPANVTWLTGIAPPLQVGPTPFLGNPAYVWYREGRFICLVQNSLADSLEALATDRDVTVVPYTGYTLDQAITVGANIERTFYKVLEQEPPQGRVGVEAHHLPASLLETVEAHGVTPEPIDGLLEPLRMIKTSEELAKLRVNFELASLGQKTARRAVAVGKREIDVWTEVQSAIERHAGRRVVLGNDCVAGSREENIGGWPGELVLGEHDSLIVDLSTAVDGYWSDSCGTYFAGGATPEQREIHEVVFEALQYGTSMVRPGILARELHARLRGFIEAAGYEPYPHHSGHGVGTTPHELPRLAPYEERPLAAGMVIMLEPGIYLPGKTGVRLEDALLVTETGAELLTDFDKSVDG